MDEKEKTNKYFVALCEKLKSNKDENLTTLDPWQLAKMDNSQFQLFTDSLKTNKTLQTLLFSLFFFSLKRNDSFKLREKGRGNLKMEQFKLLSDSLRFNAKIIFLELCILSFFISYCLLSKIEIAFIHFISYDLFSFHFKSELRNH